MNHISSLISILHFQISLAIFIIHFQTILAPVLFLNFLCKFQLPGQCPGWARCEDGAVPPSRTLVSPGPFSCPRRVMSSWFCVPGRPGLEVNPSITMHSELGRRILCSIHETTVYCMHSHVHVEENLTMSMN